MRWVLQFLVIPWDFSLLVTVGFPQGPVQMSSFSCCNWWGGSSRWWKRGRGLPSAGVEIKGPGSSGNEQAANRRTARRIRRKVWVVMIAVARTVWDRKMGRSVSESTHTNTNIDTHTLQDYCMVFNVARAYLATRSMAKLRKRSKFT